MANYSFSNTLDGLNNIEANDINTDNINTDYLTVNINSSVPLVTPYTSNTNQIASCAFVQDAFTNNLLNYVTLDTAQTITGSKIFKASTWVSGSDLRVLDISSNQGIQIFNSNNTNNITTLQGIGANSKFSINTRDATTQRSNIIISNGNQITIQGTANEGIEILNNLITINGSLTLNKPFVSNYVDLTLTIYENQFKGDIYGYRGVVCQNGFYVKDGPGAGANTYALIDTSGNISTTSNISAQSITLPNNSINDAYLSSNVVLKNGTNNMTGTTNFNTLTNTCLTQTTGTNNTTIANTAFVQNSLTGYLKLNNGGSNQTLTGTGQTIINTPTTFNDTVILNNSTSLNNTITIYDGTNATQFDQNGVNLTIYSTGGIKMGSGFLDNIVCSSNRAYLQGSVGNTIDMNGTQATIGGSSVPKITTQPASGSNTNEIATTQWSKTQLSGYAVLNGNNTFTGTNTQNDIGGTGTSTSQYQTGVAYSITNNYNNGSIRLNTRNASGVRQDGVYALNGNRAGLQGDTNNTLEIEGSICTVNCGTFKSNSPYTCGYYTISTPLTTKTNYQIGYMWTIPGSNFTSWYGYGVTAGNVITLPWDGSGDKTLGVWRCDIILVTNSASSIISGMNFNVTSGTFFNVNTRSTWETGLAIFPSGSCQILKLSFTMEITNLTTIYYLNFLRTGGSSLSDNTAASQIQFTRIA